jgi:hypothetical protein
MYSRMALQATRRLVIALTICAAVIGSTNVSLFVSEAQNAGQNRHGKPRPGKPEGSLPDLNDVQNESHVEREPAAPIPSTMRSPKVPLNPWSGKRLGDPGTRGDLGQAINRTRRAHAGRRAFTPPSVLDDQFISSFFTFAVLRSPVGDEPTFWRDQLRVAYAQGQTSLKLAAVELGKTLFESAEYAARNRNASEYVSDLYKTYLMKSRSMMACRKTKRVRDS